MKYFLYKLRQDFSKIKKYPTTNISENGKVDYDKYWQKRRGENYQSSLSSWQKERADIVKEYFKTGDTVVDVGGGDGAMLKYLQSQVNIRAIVVDFNDIVLQEAQKIGLEVIKIDLNDINDIKKIPTCDYILGFEILEHLSNPEEFIFLVKDRVKKSMIFSFPNTGYYTHRLRLLFGRFPLQWVHHPGEHLHFWTVSDVRWWVKYLGFKLLFLHIYEGLPGFKKIWPTLFGQGIIIVISKDNL
jgi:methionine biosynthesis protein MetW